MHTITTNAFPDHSAAAEMPATMTNELDVLIAAHKAMMATYEAAFDLDDADEMADVQEPLYEKLLETRKAILGCRPRTLEEVAMKATLMMGDRAFNFWDIDGVDVEGHFPEVIASLIPVAPEAEAFANAA